MAATVNKPKGGKVYGKPSLNQQQKKRINPYAVIRKKFLRGSVLLNFLMIKKNGTENKMPPTRELGV